MHDDGDDDDDDNEKQVSNDPYNGELCEVMTVMIQTNGTKIGRKFKTIHRRRSASTRSTRFDASNQTNVKDSERSQRPRSVAWCQVEIKFV